MTLGSALPIIAVLVKKVGGYSNTKLHGNLMTGSAALMAWVLRDLLE